MEGSSENNPVFHPSTIRRNTIRRNTRRKKDGISVKRESEADQTLQQPLISRGVGEV